MSALVSASGTDGHEEKADTEDRHAALQLWWERNSSAMSDWFTALSTESQIGYLRKASPDMPTQTAASRELAGEKINASDVLLPELTLDGLLGADGKLLPLFFSRRCQQQDRCYFADIQLLNAMFARGAMPLFSNGVLKDMDTPFVDPADTEENIRSLNTDTSSESRATILAHLITGRLIHAEVYVTLKVRRASLVQFMEVLVGCFEKEHIGQVSPTYDALLKSELDQQRVTQEMADEHGAAEDDEAETEEA